MIINSIKNIIVTKNDKILKLEEDYTIENNTLFFNIPPEANDKISIIRREDVETNS